MFNLFSKKRIIEPKLENKENKKKIEKTHMKKINLEDIKTFFKSFVAFLKKYRKIVYIVCILIFIIIASLIGYNYWYNEVNKEYVLKMQSYGFDKMYDNSKATPSDKVTKSEAIKLIIASIYNIYDISNMSYDTTETYPNALWVKYAEKIGIISEGQITAQNQNDKISYIDAISIYLNARDKLLNIKIHYDKEAKFSDIRRYTTAEQSYINDAVANGLIDDSTFKIKADNNLDKARFNKLVVKFVEKYNTITVKGDKININKDKIPSNSNIYPYTLSSVDKSVYEIGQYSDTMSKNRTPVEVYVKKKEQYEQIKQKLEGYFNAILNVDYTTINIQDFRNNVEPNSLYLANTQDELTYIDYVKSNKIKITGKATAQMPIIYFDGRYYRARAKVEFKIESADKKENLLYCDYKSTTVIKYTKDSYSIYLDVPMSMTLNGSSLYVVNLYPVSSMIAGSVNANNNM